MMKKNALVVMMLVCLIVFTSWAGTEMSEAEGLRTLQGLTGQVSEVEIAIRAQDKIVSLSSSRPPEDINLKRMAEWALNYLSETPRKHLDYEPVFDCFTFQCPPAPQGHDPVVSCDTDTRMDWQWYYMREITGSDKGRDVEAAFHKRIRSYIDNEGVGWGTPGAFNESATGAIYKKEDYLVHMWGMTKILRSLSLDYARTKDPQSKDLARKVMLATKKMATWDDKGRCWLTCGAGGYKSDKVTPSGSWTQAHPAPIVGPLITYWQATGDGEALEFAKAYAEGIINNLQPGGIRFQPDGSFQGHSHITMHAVWTVAELGIVTGEKKYIEFAKRSWDFMLTRGTGTGWFPAGPDSCSEVCCVSDMMSTAALIAQAGYPQYYDYVERYMRNEISNLQFIVTDKFEAKYAEINKAAGEEKIKQGLHEVKKFQGGFYNCGLNDFENDLLGRGGYVWKVTGCCSPSGMQAIYTTWENTIAHFDKSSLGPAGVYVNMSFNRDSKWGEVISFLPEKGRLTVVASVKDTFFIRPPHWAPREKVGAFINSKPITLKWRGAYVQFDAKPNDELTITYPLIKFKHDVEGIWNKSAPNLHMTYYWLGNMVTGVEPPPNPGTTPLYLYTGLARVLPPAP